MDVKIDNRVSRKEGGVLAKLWRNILTETNMMPALDFLIKRYVSENDSMDGRVKAVKRKTKSSLVKNISATDMTWKTFLDLLFNFMKVKRLTISMKLTFANGNETVHSVIVDNASMEFSDLEVESDTKTEKKK